MHDIFLRRLQSADIAGLTELIRQAFGSLSLSREIGDHLALYAASDQSVALITEQAHLPLPAEYWVAWDSDAGRVVAISGIYRFWWTSQACLWLGWFCVAPDHQRRGLGSSVIRQTMAIARARGAAIFKVETERSNSAALFYEKHGFRREAILTGHYPGNIDALVLARNLDDVEISEIKELYKLEYTDESTSDFA